MARYPKPRRTRPAALAALLTAVFAGCSSSGPTTASADRGMSSGDAVGRSLFNPEARAMARSPRSGSRGAVASVIIYPD
ncbi:MAG: hypothetical protein IT436_18235 [Phycisphaerales bacterium]|nr:hypothetical protein [Phycisphaerales bacterium]